MSIVYLQKGFIGQLAPSSGGGGGSSGDPSNLVVNIPDAGVWANRAANSPFIDTVGNRVRAPGTTSFYTLSEPIAAGSGWHSFAVDSNEPTTTTTLSIGLEAEALAVVDLTSSTNRLMVIGDEGYFNGSVVLPFPVSSYVVAIDYSGTNPIVHLITGGTVISSSTFVTTDPLQVVVRCGWLSVRDWQFELNMGLNLANRPFPAGTEAALTTAGADTTGFQEGVNGSNTGTARAEATLSISGEPASPIVGALVTLTATCTDSLSNDRSSEVRWYNDGENWNNPEGGNVGATYAYTIPQLGHYDIRCEYMDPEGRIVRDTATIFADGSLTQVAETVWSPTLSNSSVASIVGNQARFETALPFKLAVIGNQGMWGEWKYVEITIETDDTASQFGIGLTTLLNGDIMWSGRSGELPGDGAGSFSLVNQAPGDLGFTPAVWNNGAPGAALDGVGGISPDATGMRFGHGNTIGFAVDFRDKTALPIIYMIALDHALGAARCFGSFRLRQAHSPLYPMAYCNIASNETVDFDVSVNGGSTALAFDPVAVLTAASVDTTGLVPRWSDNDTP